RSSIAPCLAQQHLAALRSSELAAKKAASSSILKYTEPCTAPAEWKSFSDTSISIAACASEIMLCIIVGYAASYLFPPPSRSLAGLTIYDRKTEEVRGQTP
ncbi:MAG: hypothetical protein ACRD3R_03380, partial [Terriglobales bacterium]